MVVGRLLYSLSRAEPSVFFVRVIMALTSTQESRSRLTRASDSGAVLAICLLGSSELSSFDLCLMRGHIGVLHRTLDDLLFLW